ncbi:DUF6520 family protein [Fulvivirgaceae bacterium BMA12]|uniref:DUF6520 family protein n=1 Tax=Agaribacillus aureus TaxID=3051825 RepID=A0ABT8LK22_9BACT|nr:DUF6520 family protein [Fulvivirgaceae bacterium BMA12]
MKSLKSILAALAFVFAVGAAFAFKPAANPHFASDDAAGLVNCRAATASCQDLGTQQCKQGNQGVVFYWKSKQGIQCQNILTRP